ncbi:hypothetical protein CRM93_12170 [Acetobacter fabarum]|uniref:Uncharacterized protein n=1 Tax=Acetobacter fabarum TaxID=483199 RepID=A0A269XXT7_9PROT|nr:hypothetical protein B8X00_10000 [Acetobacter fabarum]PEN23264.1 hypothetical protein CRM93_12170 [Acetobacter fabarum]
MPAINNDMGGARLRAAFIQDLRNFVDNTDVIHAAVDSDLYWFPEMLALARRADDLATRLEEWACLALFYAAQAPSGTLFLQ